MTASGFSLYALSAHHHRLRRGECIGLKWKDIDEERAVLKIQRNVTYTAKSGTVVNTPKTVASQRMVPIMGSTLGLLQRLKQQRQKEHPDVILEDSFLFPSKTDLFAPHTPRRCHQTGQTLYKFTGIA